MGVVRGVTIESGRAIIDHDGSAGGQAGAKSGDFAGRIALTQATRAYQDFPQCIMGIVLEYDIRSAATCVNRSDYRLARFD